jgi:hypothetical protein
MLKVKLVDTVFRNILENYSNSRIPVSVDLLISCASL